MWKGINGDIAWTLDAHYYLGCGNRGGREREIVYKVNDEMSYQNVAGTLNPGGHPGSYNGQDAYNDMLVTNGVFNSEIGHIQSVKSSAHSVGAGLQGRNRPHNRGGALTW